MSRTYINSSYLGPGGSYELKNEETDFRNTIIRALMVLGSELPEKKRQELTNLIDEYYDKRDISERWEYKGEENA